MDITAIMSREIDELHSEVARLRKELSRLRDVKPEKTPKAEGRRRYALPMATWEYIDQYLEWDMPSFHEISSADLYDHYAKNCDGETMSKVAFLRAICHALPVIRAVKNVGDRQFRVVRNLRVKNNV